MACRPRPCGVSGRWPRGCVGYAAGVGRRSASAGLVASWLALAILLRAHPVLGLEAFVEVRSVYYAHLVAYFGHVEPPLEQLL